MRMLGLCLGAALVGAAGAAAQDLRSVEAHVHGEAEIAAALGSDGRLLVTFSSPLVNLTGFEHAPRDEAEQAALGEVLATLGAGSIVVPNAQAQCVFASATLGAPSFGDEEHGPGENQDAESAGGHDHAAGRAHADVGVMLFFDCAADERLTSLALPLFDLYPGVTRVDATFLGDDRQIYRELSPGRSFNLHD